MKRTHLYLAVLLVVLACLLCSCTNDAERYKTAQEKLTAGDYAGAVTAFKEIEKYEDSGKYITYITALQSAEAGDLDAAVAGFTDLGDFNDSSTQANYYAACAAEGRQDWETAMALYAKIPDFKDASARLAALPDTILDSELAAAVTAMRNGEAYQDTLRQLAEKDYTDPAVSMKEKLYALAEEEKQAGRNDTAYSIYELLSSYAYSDAAQIVKQLDADALYNSNRLSDAWNIYAGLDAKYHTHDADYQAMADAAAVLVSEGKYDKAITAYQALGSYSDCEEKVKESTYQKAKTLAAAGSYDEAVKVFTDISDYQDSAECIIQAEADQKYANGDQVGAWLIYAGLDEQYRTHAADYKALYEDGIPALSDIIEYTDSDEQIHAYYAAKAAQLENDGSYEAAYAEYENAGNSEKMQETAYQTAVQNLSGCDYESAVAWFEKADTYSDTKEQLLSIGEYYYANQQYDLAEAVYVKALGTGAAAQRLYGLGAYYEAAGDSKQAARCYREAGTYEDAQDKANEQVYQAAEALYAAKDLQGAKVLYADIVGYKDADSKIAACDAEISTVMDLFTQVGSIVTYGHYEQDANEDNGTEAIEWIVLEYDSTTERALLISRYVLDARRFDAGNYQGWDKSEIREWLNSTFLNEAFTGEEQQGIAITKISTPSYGGYSGSLDTEDKLWLLGRGEALNYFANDEARKCIPTAYAIKNGAFQSRLINLDGVGCCWWWLRSPGDQVNRASRVDLDGSLTSYRVYFADCTVRPAFWIDLNTATLY